MRKRKNNLIIICLIFAIPFILCGCNNSGKTTEAKTETTEKTKEEKETKTKAETQTKEEKEVKTTTGEDMTANANAQKTNTENTSTENIAHITALNPVKNPMDHNPLMTQAYSADPYALVYNDRLYIYMTGDEPMYEADGSKKNNNYSNINTIRVISSEDLVNWTDHGEIMAAGKQGEAKWGNNSWAPAACYKNIDGKDKFFLYFANSGNGIAVLTADSPTGPFTDPLGKALISRDTPTCAEVTWLFDPAVLIDDDGTGYLYFGGGVPSEDKASNPGTARVVKLADDMISLAEDPVPIENVLYLFEDSGINKIGDKYIYSYCSNFNVPASGAEGYGFESGEIIIMESDSPKGPFTTVGGVLKNPERFFSFGGNNHHCMFSFKDKWYITYHASLVEEKLGDNKGYRNVNIDEIEVGEDNLFKVTRGTKEGVKQLGNYNPYEESLFSTMANQAGVKTTPAIETSDNANAISCGLMNLITIEDGAFTEVSGVDFAKGATSCLLTVKSQNGGSINIRTKYLNGEDIGTINVEASDSFKTYEIPLKEEIKGIGDLYFIFENKGMELKSWKFVPR